MPRPLEPLVRQVIKDHNFLADDDKLLLLAVWKQEGLVFSEDQRAAFLHRCHTPESITRLRRKLIEDGEIDQSAEAQARRKEQQEFYYSKYRRQQRLI